MFSPNDFGQAAAEATTEIVETCHRIAQGEKFLATALEAALKRFAHTIAEKTAHAIINSPARKVVS